MKTPFSVKLPLIIINTIIFLTVISCSTTLSEIYVFTHKIGDNGPGGGKVFYRSEKGFYVEGENYGKTCHYLEAAPTDASPTVLEFFSTGGIDVKGNSKEIGTGNKNTIAIITEGGADALAATACKNYSSNSLTDWFLPSERELNELFNQRVHPGIVTGVYWSSSDDGHNNFWGHNFSTGEQINHGGGNKLNVRAIRAF